MDKPDLMTGTAGSEDAKRQANAALRLAFALVAAVAVLDQASKWAILEVVMQPPRVIEMTGFFNLVLTFNCGISFGILGGACAWWHAWVLTALALAVSAGLLYWLHREPARILALAVGLIVGGAVGNVVDRLRFGAVVDFLDLHLGTWHWPAFNLADSAIVAGVAFLVFDGLFRERLSSKN